MLPRIESLAITPNSFDQPPCASAAVRPEVTARISDPDDKPTALRVTLSYNLEGSYQGQATMKYNAGSRLFTYRLPSVDGRYLSGDGGHLSVIVTVQDHTGGGPRPSSPAIATINSCMPVGN